MSFAASKLGLVKGNINPAYVGRKLEYCINKVGCKAILLPSSVKSIDSLSIFRHLVPELDQQSSTKELSLKRLPTSKHIILTGKQQSSKSLPIHSYRNLLEHGAKISHNKLNKRHASVIPDSFAAIFFCIGLTEHLGPHFTRFCVPIPMFHIFCEVVGVLNVATSKCQMVFPAILRWMPRLEVKVVDRGGTPVSYIGQQGEIWARGFPIMLGGYGDTQKTNEAITPSD
ncbi:unnamed protein product [Rotaria socialis]|uniref:AMP-dependent synthetase/ligase domain-containing protein n=1 Tax=Rotaria socialis TaxID=392032 RepID=A0A817XAB2_9BILA|nr:unnamed protein product [Rotaria socialis]CAF4535237.1 unnamed protein product [Rotaria socialis]